MGLPAPVAILAAMFFFPLSSAASQSPTPVDRSALPIPPVAFQGKHEPTEAASTPLYPTFIDASVEPTARIDTLLQLRQVMIVTHSA